MTDEQVTITVRENGPYLVKGPAMIVDADGNEHPKERDIIALCRCGGSTTKPFCDGTHSRIGFAAAERAVGAAAAPTDEAPADGASADGGS
jgi:CDGSH-type Zn-finger protein